MKFVVFTPAACHISPAWRDAWAKDKPGEGEALKGVGSYSSCFQTGKLRFLGVPAPLPSEALGVTPWLLRVPHPPTVGEAPGVGCAWGQGGISTAEKETSCPFHGLPSEGPLCKQPLRSLPLGDPSSFLPSQVTRGGWGWAGTGEVLEKVAKTVRS